MNQVWHLFRYDVKRSWPLLAGWLAFLLIVWARALRDPLERPFGALLDPVPALPTWVALLAGWAGIGMLIVNDAPGRPGAFWKTRPVGGRALLASKAVFGLLVFLAAPLLLHAAWSFRFGYSVAQWFPEAVMQAFWLAAVLLPMAAVASLVPSFSAYVAWSIGLSVATLLAQAALQNSVPVGFRGETISSLSGWFVTGVSALLTSLVYLRWRKSTVLLLSLAAWLILNVSFLDLGAALSFRTPSRHGRAIPGVTATLVPPDSTTGEFVVGVETAYDGRNRFVVPGRLAIEGLQPDSALFGVRLTGTIAFSSHPSIEIVEAYSSAFYQTPLPGAPDSDEWQHSPEIALKLSRELPSGRPPHGRLDARLDGLLAHVRFLGASPIVEGARIETGQFGFEVQRISMVDQKLEFYVRRRFLASTVSNEPWPQLRIVRRGDGPQLQLSGTRSMDDHGNPRVSYLFPSPEMQDSPALVSLHYTTDRPDLAELELQAFCLQSDGYVSIPLVVEDFRLVANTK